MKAIKTLVKLQKKELDDLLVQITNLDIKKDEAEAYLRYLISSTEHEMRAYSATEYAFMLEHYLTHACQQQKLYQKQIEELAKNIDVLRDQLFEKFSELKKLEITLERRKKAIKAALMKQEDKELDEATVLRYSQNN